jgi:superfamily II DNA or RNA helicase/HKD family nuclease
MSLPDGLYERVLTERLAAQVATIGERARTRTINAGEADLLCHELSRQLASALEALASLTEDQASLQLGLLNDLLLTLRKGLNQLGLATDGVVETLPAPAQLLQSVQPAARALHAPDLGLSEPWLFTAGKGSPALLHEIRQELASADSVDILMSFITVSGVRKLSDVFQQITAQGADFQGPRIRILTTTYTGATDAAAVETLARLPGCEVRISLDGRRTRLHAKAWMFHRRSGFGTAYVGSANLSGAALTGGLEWTVKLTQHRHEAPYARACAHFETLWADDEFVRFDPTDSSQQRALREALGRETFGADGSIALSGLDIKPKHYQAEMLEQLAAERALGRRRNLVVAATGTGKTLVAAFDYRRTCAEVGGRPRLLFVAHREEILRQALRSFREVLRDAEFGELLAGGHEPLQHDHPFATIDSITSRDLLARCGVQYWHTVVVDECHRLAADRFDRFALSVRPHVLLGLTATPERSDGQPIAGYFDQRPDGSPAVELRLWHALDLQLLTPFEYYACDDDTDFREVPWDQAGERQQLDALLAGNEARARLVVNEWRRLTADPRTCRALVFCVSVAHARFMTERLNATGLPAACIVGETDSEERRRAPQRLARGEICALVTVDLYNEGVDLPMVDTLLLLRPTQSPVLFQQQLGRGLRLADGKDSCLVLDFVGQHRSEFRFDRLLGSLTGQPRRELVESVQDGFSSLPPGCHIQLQRQAREQVLAQLQALSSQSWRRLRTELQTYAVLRGRQFQLRDFLLDTGLALDDVYRKSAGRSGWTTALRGAGLLVSEPGPEEAYLSHRLGHLRHLDDPARISALAGMAELEAPRDAQEALCWQMLTYQIDAAHAAPTAGTAMGRRLRAHADIAAEAMQLAALLQAGHGLHTRPLPGLEDTSLHLHASYSAREILTAVGWMSATRRAPFQAGVLALQERRCELLFVTLDKSAGFHDRIAYRDYAISTARFHWQSQNSAGLDTPAGQRYLDSPANGWQFQLFVRVDKATPFRACGPLRLEHCEGERPMSITWRLEVPLSLDLFRSLSVLRGV